MLFKVASSNRTTPQQRLKDARRPGQSRPFPRAWGAGPGLTVLGYVWQASFPSLRSELGVRDAVGSDSASRPCLGNRLARIGSAGLAVKVHPAAVRRLCRRRSSATPAHSPEMLLSRVHMVARRQTWLFQSSCEVILPMTQMKAHPAHLHPGISSMGSGPGKSHTRPSDSIGKIPGGCFGRVSG